MKSLRIAATYGLATIFCGALFAQNSEEDLDIIRAKNAFKTRMKEETTSVQSGVISKIERYPETKVELLTPVIYLKQDYIPIFEKPQSLVVQPLEDKSKVRLAFFVDGEKVPTARGIYASDRNLSFKAYSMVEKNELVIIEFQIDLMRNGRKISSEKLPGAGSIERLSQLAQEGDFYLITIKEFFEKTNEGNLKTFSKGSLRLNMSHLN